MALQISRDVKNNQAPELSKTTIMFSRLSRLIGTAVIALSLTGTGVASSDSSDNLKIIDNPGGGQVVYGPLTGVSTMRDAMATMLKQVHGHFGDRPQIGKFFRTKGSDSVATFFQLTAKNQGGTQIAGLVIVSMPAGMKPSAAVLFDSANHFDKSEPVMMKKLNEALQKESAHSTSTSGNSTPRSSSSAGSGPGGVFGTNDPATALPSQPLHQAVAPDNSGSIGLPAGWHVTGGSGGSLAAEGPKGESIRMGIINQNIYDPRTQQGANMLNYMRRGSVPFSACPYSSDLAADYQCVAGQNRQRRNLPPISMRVINIKTQPGNPYEGAMLAEMDFHDGKGVMTSSIRAGAQRMGPGTWILTISEVDIPKDLADQEWPTVSAMITTYRQNAAVIQGETNQVIAQINARADANRKLADARSAANDVHNAGVEARWDEQAKQNKAFENYTLDRAVIHDNDQNARGTFNYPTADALVKSDPNRFQYVATQDMLKGIDY